MAWKDNTQGWSSEHTSTKWKSWRGNDNLCHKN
jgi:hypothetical protein